MKACVDMWRSRKTRKRAASQEPREGATLFGFAATGVGHKQSTIILLQCRLHLHLACLINICTAADHDCNGIATTVDQTTSMT
jgi:hypothetical protein